MLILVDLGGKSRLGMDGWESVGLEGFVWRLGCCWY